MLLESRKQFMTVEYFEPEMDEIEERKYQTIQEVFLISEQQKKQKANMKNIE